MTPLTLARDEQRSSHLRRAWCPLVAKVPNHQGQLALVEVTREFDFLAPFWRIGVLEMAC